MGEAVNPTNMNSRASSGGGGGNAAAGASIASLGLSTASSLVKGQATADADEFQAARASRAAEFGKLQADLTDTVMRENLNTTLSNIDVIRSAAHIDLTSPTTAAFEERQRMVADRQREASLLTIKSQVREDEESAAYLRKAGDAALSMSYLNAATGVFGALGKAGAAAG